MGAQAPIPPDPQPNHNGEDWHNPVVHGSKAAIAAAIFACIAALFAGGTFYVNWSNRSDQKTQQIKDQFNTDVNKLIDAKLTPGVKAVNDHIDEKIGELSNQIHSLDVRIARLEGPLTKRVSGIETRVKQNEAIARLRDDPEKILDTIRAEIQLAMATKKEIPDPKLVDFKLAVRAIPQTSYDYWKTVAAIINYQSLIDQISGRAPDPSTISEPCPVITNGFNGSVSRGNRFEGMVLERCIIDLDTNEFRNIVFKDSVIRYRGGLTTLSGVQFVNCRFVIDVRGTAPASLPENRLLLALLDSPSLAKIQLPATH